MIIVFAHQKKLKYKIKRKKLCDNENCQVLQLTK